MRLIRRNTGGKVLIVDFLVMECKFPYNVILGRDWMISIEVITSTRFQCIKFPHNDRIAKVRKNQWQVHSVNEKPNEDIRHSEVKGKIILSMVGPAGRNIN